MNDANVERCPETEWLVLLLLAIYMIVINILLLNLLIAMFRCVSISSDAKLSILEKI
jgi:hypothetical protein